MSGTHGTLSSVEDRALVLLGQGISPERTADACGVSVSRISQLLSDEQFAAKVTALKYEALQKHNEQDNSYDDIERALTTKLKDSIPLMMRPMEILKAVQVINAAKRRGSSAPETIHEKQTVVAINLPPVIINNFTSLVPVTNNLNQVVKVGETDLVTMQSGTLLNKHKATLEAAKPEVNTNVLPAPRKRYDPTDV